MKQIPKKSLVPGGEKSCFILVLFCRIIVERIVNTVHDVEYRNAGEIYYLHFLCSVSVPLRQIYSLLIAGIFLDVMKI